jgi:DNA-directed RNA polymerase subunit RPC12/RpoP
MKLVKSFVKIDEQENSDWACSNCGSTTFIVKESGSVYYSKTAEVNDGGVLMVDPDSDPEYGDTDTDEIACENCSRTFRFDHFSDIEW